MKTTKTTKTTNKSAAPKKVAAKKSAHASGMKMNRVLEVIRGLSHSQGMYGRLLHDIQEFRIDDPERYRAFVKDIEYEEFKEPLDVVLFFEEGKHTDTFYEKKEKEGHKVYTVKVKRKLECSATVIAKSKKEAEKEAIRCTTQDRSMTSVKAIIMKKDSIRKYIAAEKKEAAESSEAAKKKLQAALHEDKKNTSSKSSNKKTDAAGVAADGAAKKKKGRAGGRRRTTSHTPK